MMDKWLKEDGAGSKRKKRLEEEEKEQKVTTDGIKKETWGKTQK